MGDRNTTQIGIRKLLRGEKLTEEEQIAVDNSLAGSRMVSKLLLKLAKSWLAWLISVLSTCGYFAIEYLQSDILK